MIEASSTTRREFLVTAAASLGASALPRTQGFHPGLAEGPLRVGLIGCGGRGTGATVNALRSRTPAVLVAMADVFADRLARSLRELLKPDHEIAERVMVDEDHRFVGFDAVDRVLASDVEVVILATPPHFRPAHLTAAIRAGKHVFMEKPVAVDGPGVRAVLAAGDQAEARGLRIACGLQRHHQDGYIATMERVHEGALGDIVAARAYWNGGALWMHQRQPEWSDMEWQLRNWLYFTWLSGDHIVEQHVHNLDVVNWAKGSRPVRCFGVGGRQVRTDPAYGHIFDHHDVHYEYPDGSWMFSQCRQMDNCANKVSEHLIGTRARADLDERSWSITGGGSEWRFKGPKKSPYQAEFDDLFQSIREGRSHNEARYAAESTLTAIMGRMATYTGRVVTWDEAMTSTERLGPKTYVFRPLPCPPVARPGL